MATIFKSKYPDVHIPTTLSFPQFALQHFNQYPKDLKVLIDPVSHDTYTCSQLQAAVNKVAAGFHKRGLQKGDVVALCFPNSIHFPSVLFGVQILGATPSTFNPLNTADEILYQLKDCGAKYIVTTPQVLEKINTIIGSLKSQIKEVVVFGDVAGTVSFKSLTDNNGEFPHVEFDPCTTLALIPGTTGLSKGVQLSHYNLIASILTYFSVHVPLYRDHETIICCLPLYQIYGVVIMAGMCIWKGFTLVVMPRFDLAGYLQLVQEYKSEVLHLVPPIVVLLSKDPIVSKYDTSRIRLVFCGAAPLGATTEEALKTRLPNVTLIQQYGMTEMSPNTHSNTISSQVPGSVGRLIPNITAKLVDPTAGKEVGVGQTGEILIKGPNRMMGYLHNPTETANTIDKDGYLRTGDIAYVDENENFFIVDRLKELIKYKAYQVAPAELEALLLTHPDIADAAVVGKPDPEAGELPTAFVVLRKGSTLKGNDIVMWADNKVAPYKKLRGGVVLVDAIAKSPPGKILRRLMRAKL